MNIVLQFKVSIVVAQVFNNYYADENACFLLRNIIGSNCLARFLSYSVEGGWLDIDMSWLDADLLP